METDTFILLSNLEGYIDRKLTNIEHERLTLLLDKLPANTSFNTKQSIMDTIGQLMVIYEQLPKV
jgi:hypothetical protein